MELESVSFSGPGCPGEWLPGNYGIKLIKHCIFGVVRLPFN